MRRLIINADDFGRSPGINRGIAACHERGVVTSTSLMVRWPAALEAAGLAHRFPSLSVGLHIDLCEWSQSGGNYHPLYEVVPLDDEIKVRDEILRQIEAFAQLMGGTPTHLDSHQHVHHKGVARRVAGEMASQLGVPLRQFHPRIRYEGGFYGQSRKGEPYPDLVSVEALTRIIESLPDGITELGCHPAFDRDVDGMYRDEREVEVATLCDPRVREAIDANGVTLVSFRDALSATP
jgi:chitin disaccharide deacetylase